MMVVSNGVSYFEPRKIHEPKIIIPGQNFLPPKNRRLEHHNTDLLNRL